MPGNLDVLYREAPIGTLERIDEASVPDCGAAALARLRTEACRRRRISEFYIWPLWLTSCALLCGIAAFRQQPMIAIVSFIVLRDVCLGFWLNNDGARLTELAIGEIVKAHGQARTEREDRLRRTIAIWNSDAKDCMARLAGSEWLSIREGRLRREAYQLGEQRRALTAEIRDLRGGGRGAA